MTTYHEWVESTLKDYKQQINGICIFSKDIIRDKRHTKSNLNLARKIKNKVC